MVGLSQNALLHNPLSVSFVCLGTDIHCLVSGKKKRGGVRVHPKTVIAEVLIQERRMPVVAAIEGTLIEINERLEGEPGLLRDSEARGWVAVVMPARKGR